MSLDKNNALHSWEQGLVSFLLQNVREILKFAWRDWCISATGNVRCKSQKQPVGIFLGRLYFLAQKIFSSRSSVAQILESRFSGVENTF